MSEIQSVSAEIATELKTCIPEWYGRGACFVEHQPTVIPKRNSLILRYFFQYQSCDVGHIYVKIARRPRFRTLADAILSPDMRQRAHDEYRLLTDIANAARSYAPDELCALRPLGYFPRWNGVVTEELNSRSLKSLMFTPRTLLNMSDPPQQIERAFRLAGSWLYMFHHMVGDFRQEAFDDTEIMADSERIFNSMKRLSTYDLSHVREVFQNRVRSYRGEQMPTALIHGDFGAFNVIVTSDGRVGSLDVSEIRRGPIYLDIGWFLADLRVNGLQALSWGNIMTKKTLKVYQQAFLRGYFGEQDLDHDLLTLMSLYYVLFKWLQHKEKLQRQPKHTFRFVRPWIERYFYQVTLKLTAHLESR